MSPVLQGLLDVPSPVAYAVIALLVFGEAAVFVGFVLPGETAVVLGGVMASTQKLSLPLLLALVVVAAITGDSVGYEVGKKFGPRLLASRALSKHQGKVAGAQGFLRERGGSAVFIGRFTAFLRAVIPGLAGASGMRYRRFLAFNAVGGIVWGIGFTLVGYFAGSSYATVERTLGRGTAVLTAVLVLGVVVAVVVARHRKVAHAEQASDSAS